MAVGKSRLVFDLKADLQTVPLQVAVVLHAAQFVRVALHASTVEEHLHRYMVEDEM